MSKDQNIGKSPYWIGGAAGLGLAGVGVFIFAPVASIPLVLLAGWMVGRLKCQGPSQTFETEPVMSQELEDLRLANARLEAEGNAYQSRISELTEVESQLRVLLDIERNPEIESTEHLVNVQEILDLRTDFARVADSVASQVAVSIEEADAAVQLAISNFCGLVENANELSNVAQEALGNCEGKGIGSTITQAQSTLDRLVSRMSGNSATMKVASNSVGELGRVTSQLEQLLDEIESVSRQTAMLSLNASVEAARAGEMGKGFAVVAHEVRRLSQRSRDMAQKTRDLTHSISTGSKEVVHVLAKAVVDTERDSLASVKEVSGLTEAMTQAQASTEGALGQLSNQVYGISNKVQQIVMAMQFQDLLRQRLQHAVGAMQDYVSPDVERVSVGIGVAPSESAIRYEKESSEEEAADITLF